MKAKLFLILSLTALASLLLVTAAGAKSIKQPDKSALARVRRATAGFKQPSGAMAAGYGLEPGLDACFDNPGVGGMGYHYINTDLLDTKLNPLTPEAMVYSSTPEGRLKLGAVEYIVPAALWDQDHSEPPMVLGQHLHLNPALGVYILHAWIWRYNPSGIFQDWNPMVSCP
jgi:hypothetical protein